MNEMKTFLDVLEKEKFKYRGGCKLCAFLNNSSPEDRDIVSAAVWERNSDGEFVYSGETLAKALKAQGALTISSSSVKRHRSLHEPGQ